MIADPLHSVSILRTGEDVKTYFRPVGNTLRDFDCLMQLMIGGIYAIYGVHLSFCRKVGMQFEHGAFWFNCRRSIDLNFVVALRKSFCSTQQNDKRDAQDALQKTSALTEEGI